MSWIDINDLLPHDGEEVEVLQISDNGKAVIKGLATYHARKDFFAVDGNTSDEDMKHLYIHAWRYKDEYHCFPEIAVLEDISSMMFDLGITDDITPRERTMYDDLRKARKKQYEVISQLADVHHGYRLRKGETHHD